MPSQQRRALERFEAHLQTGAPSLDLVEACGLVAEHLGHPIGAAQAVERVDRLADQVAAAVRASGDPVAVASVVRVLYGPLGFRGDRQHYGDPRNSLLPEVIGRRMGIPITLAVVVLGVATRLGLAADGIGMPGHFLVADGRSTARWLDPFDGSWLDEAGVVDRFRSVHGPEAPFQQSFLRPTPPRRIIARVLTNLVHSLRTVGDPTRLLRTLELLDVVPDSGWGPQAQVDLAEAQAAVGRPADAIETLQRVVPLATGSARTGLEARIARLRASLN